MTEIERKTKRYPTDLTDEESSKIEPFLPGTARTGRRRQVDLREVFNAILFLARTGCGWRMLPKDFPPWQTSTGGSGAFFVCLLLFQTIHDAALMLYRDYLLTRCRAWRRMSHRSGVEARPGGIMIKRFWLTHG